jgi:hypothetical protein
MSDKFFFFDEENQKTFVSLPRFTHLTDNPYHSQEIHSPRRWWGQNILSSPTLYWTSYPKHALEPSKEPEVSEPSDYERLAARHKMLLTLVGSEELSARLEHLFPHNLEKGRMLLIIDQEVDASLADYVRFLGSIDRLYKLILTLVHKGYFYDRWLRGVIPTFAPDDLLGVERLVKNSPAEVQVSVVAEAARALGDVFSIGKQVTDFRMAGIKVQEAKLELEKKTRALEEDNRKRQQQSELADLDLEIEHEKKLLELEQLRTRRDEEQRKRHRLLMDDVDQRFALLSKVIKVLSEVPDEVKAELKAALFAEIEIMNATPLSISSLQLLPKD